jgi:hypothetical protein
MASNAILFFICFSFELLSGGGSHRTLGRRALTLKVDKTLFLFRDSASDVDHREQHENVCLQK